LCRNPPDVPLGTHKKCVASATLGGFTPRVLPLYYFEYVGRAKNANPPYI